MRSTGCGMSNRGHSISKKAVPEEWLTPGADAMVGAEIDKVWISKEDGARLGFIITRIGLTPVMMQAWAALFGGRHSPLPDAMRRGWLLLRDGRGRGSGAWKHFRWLLLLAASCAHLAVFAVMGLGIGYKAVWFLLLGWGDCLGGGEGLRGW